LAQENALSKYIAIALGGALGSLARYWVGAAVVNRMGARFPYGTLLINITACLIIGFSLDLLNRRAGIHPFWRFLIPVGFIGAYSTFSTFEWEAFSHVEAGAFAAALLYIALSIVLGFAAVWCGVMLARSVA
jgi:CrcB protein